MFDELGGSSGKRLDPEKISSVGIDTLKKVKAGLEALFTLVRWGRIAYLLAILVAAILLSGALVSTVNKGTYQIRQMIITGTMRNKGMTALMYAARDGHTESAKTLIDVGVDVNAQDKVGRSALMYAAGKGYTEIAKALIDAGADMNAKDNVGFTALLFATEFSHTEVVKALLDAGADVNAKDKGGWTALKFADSIGYTEIVEILKQAGARE